MGKTYESITPKIQQWIERQKLFFVASAPLAGDGLVNCSPKGLDTLRVLDPHTLAYLEYSGSGAETIAHLRENGRLVIMMCAFEGPPRIYRFYGQGEVVTPPDDEFFALVDRFGAQRPGVRSIIRLHVTRIADSCGFGVPEYSFRGERTTLGDYAEKKGESQMADYRAANNMMSLDGLPALTQAEARASRERGES